MLASLTNEKLSIFDVNNTRIQFLLGGLEPTEENERVKDARTSALPTDLRGQVRGVKRFAIFGAAKA